jgi:hypothetical protein
MAALITPWAYAESVIFSGVERSSSTTHAYLGYITPIADESLRNGWYQKLVLSSTTYGYQSNEQGPLVNIDGRSNGIGAGLGRAWRSQSATIDLSATVGYRDVRLSPYAPANDKTGNVVTLSPQLMLWRQLGSGIDTDLIASYATGIASSFVRVRVGVRPAESYRVGMEYKWLDGRNYRISKQGAFIAFRLGQKLNLELNTGRENPENNKEATYVGIALSTTF